MRPGAALVETDDCNIRRREMEQATVQHAVRLVTDRGLDQHPVIVVGHEDWHPGVAGLVASRIRISLIARHA